MDLRKILIRPSTVAVLMLAMAAFNIAVQAQNSPDAGPAVSVRVTSIWKVANTPNVGNNNFLFAIAGDSPTDIWAVGSHVPGSLAQHFNGVKWSSIATPNATALNGVAVLSPTNAWAVGQDTDSNLHDTPVIQHFDGTQWAIVPSPQFPSGGVLSDVKAISANDVFAVGDTGQPLVEHFDGVQWSVVPTPTTFFGATLFSLAIVSPSDIWAVGGTPLGSESEQTFAIHFDGKVWQVVPVPSPKSRRSLLVGVTAIATNDVWAVGNFLGTDSLVKTLTEHWDGNSWRIVPSPNVGGSSALAGLASISHSDVWASGCGPCLDAGAGQHPLVEHWDGTRWTVSATPLVAAGDVARSVLAFPPGDVFIAGTAAAALPPRFRTLILHTTQGE